MPALIDLNGNKLIAGDMVISYRYDLGKCKVVDGAQGLEYESLSSHKKVNYTLMIDAVTQRQKVEKSILNYFTIAKALFLNGISCH